MSPEERLAEKVRAHQAGLLLDTNLLLLHLADCVGPAFASRWSRTSHLGERYLVPLRAAVRTAARAVTTPHILTEATNLATGGKSGDADLQSLRDLIRLFAHQARERFTRARVLVEDPAFMRLGLADIAQLGISRRGRPLILTIDAPLAAELERRSLPVANLTHFAFPAEEFR